MQKKHKKYTLLAVYLVTVLSFGVLYNLNSDAPVNTNTDPSTPPQLSIQLASSNTLSGQLNINLTQDIGCYLDGHTFTQDQVDNFQSSGSTIAVAQGHFLYHSDRDMSMQKIIDNIQPSLDNKITIAHYSPTNNPDKQFALYPGTIQDPSSYTIPAHQGFMIIACKETLATNFKNSLMPASGVPQYLSEPTSQWVLAAVPNNFNFQNYRTASFWPQQAARYADLSNQDDPVITAFPLDHPLQDTYEFTNKQNKLAWILVFPQLNQDQVDPDNPINNDPTDNIIEDIRNGNVTPLIPEEQIIEVEDNTKDLPEPTPLPENTLPENAGDIEIDDNPLGSPSDLIPGLPDDNPFTPEENNDLIVVQPIPSVTDVLNVDPQVADLENTALIITHQTLMDEVTQKRQEVQDLAIGDYLSYNSNQENFVQTKAKIPELKEAFDAYYDFIDQHPDFQNVFEEPCDPDNLDHFGNRSKKDTMFCTKGFNKMRWSTNADSGSANPNRKMDLFRKLEDTFVKVRDYQSFLFVSNQLLTESRTLRDAVRNYQYQDMLTDFGTMEINDINTAYASVEHWLNKLDEQFLSSINPLEILGTTLNEKIQNFVVARDKFIRGYGKLMDLRDSEVIQKRQCLQRLAEFDRNNMQSLGATPPPPCDFSVNFQNARADFVDNTISDLLTTLGELTNENNFTN